LKNRAINRIFWLLLLIAVAFPETAAAQKKKRGNEPAQGIRLREAEFYFTEGEKYFILEDYAKALVYYHRALDIHPENATIHYKIAQVLSRSNNHDDLLKATARIEEALRLEKNNKYFYLLAADIYNGLGRFDKAADAYEEMLERIQGTEQYLFEVAAVYQYASRPADALKAYNRAEEVFGINETSSIQKLKLLLEQNKTEEALTEGEKLIAAFPGEARYVMALAEVISGKGMRDRAVVLLEKFVADHPGHSQVEMLLAGFYRDIGQDQKAQPLLLRLFDDPSVGLQSKIIIMGAYNAELHEKRTTRQRDSAREAFAVELYNKLKAAHPDDPTVKIVGGDLYLSVGNQREARQHYLDAVESGADVTFEVYENLLYLEVRLEQWDDVIRHAEDALEIYPNQGMIHYFHGVARLRKRTYDEAIFALEQAKRLLSSNPGMISEINSQLGEAYNATRQYDRSDQAYEEALAFNPANPIVLNNYSYYLAQRGQNLEKAEKMSATLIKNHPENPTFLDTYAWVLFMREKYREARKVMEKALETGKATAVHFEHYGDILYKLGDVEGAVKQWEKARGLNADSETLNRKIANRKIYD
jgi:tetratricopeptide (TPR) repeat protein